MVATPLRKFMMSLSPFKARLPIGSRVHGFTLIELMITVAVIGILSAVALPSYKSYVLRSRRAEAMASLSQAQTAIERCYAANFSYAPPTACPAPTSPSPNGFYTITASSSATTYTLTATAAGSQVADTTCNTMMIDQAGQMTALDSANNAQMTCWKR
jgi:type IV pilus assembly protein PilE